MEFLILKIILQIVTNELQNICFDSQSIGLSQWAMLSWSSIDNMKLRINFGIMNFENHVTKEIQNIDVGPKSIR